MPPLKILVIDDSPILCAGLRALGKESGFAVVAEASTAAQAASATGAARADAALLSTGMLTEDPVVVLKRLSARLAPSRVVALLFRRDRALMRRLAQQGCAVFSLRSDPPSQLLAAMKAASQGRSFFSSGLSGTMLAESFPVSALTPRESQVLDLLAQGLSSPASAAELRLSVRTVEAHRANIKSKLGIRTVAGLTRWALEHGLVDRPLKS